MELRLKLKLLFLITFDRKIQNSTRTPLFISLRLVINH